MSNSEVSSGIWRGSRPNGEAGLEGFKTILSLQCSTFERAQVFEEEDWCFNQNKDFLHVPMSLIAPPSSEDIDKALKIILSPASWPILVHCHDGVDRTGVVIAAYRMFTNQSFGSAVGEMLDKGFHLDRYFWWLPALRGNGL